MSRAFIISNWNTLTSPQKKSNLQSWLGTVSSGSGYAKITGLHFHTATTSDTDFFVGYGEQDNKAIMQASVSEDVFGQVASDRLIEAGDNILQLSSDFYKVFKARKEQEKYYNKQIDKWLEKMKKELFKDMLKAYQEMAKYYAKKYWDYTS